MNKKKALEILRMYLEGYAKNSFIFHQKFIEEFGDLITNAGGCEKEIFSLFVKQLCFVKQLGTNVHLANSNEILRYQIRPFYSLHIQGREFNLRILMSFKRNGNPVFLTVFNEKQGKRSSDYSSVISVLETRWNEV